VRRREDLTTPRSRRKVGIHYDSDAFGAFSEGVARAIGSARFLVAQTIVCVVWVGWNSLALHYDWWKWEPNDGLPLLTLVLSLQAAYAAPLILLAQTRQEDRDRTQSGDDRSVAARTQADAEFLAREVASIRIGLADVVTTDDLSDLRRLLERLDKRLDALEHSMSAQSPDPDDAHVQ
jgi:uncharacterized membrane protein